MLKKRLKEYNGKVVKFRCKKDIGANTCYPEIYLHLAGNWYTGIVDLTRKGHWAGKT